MHHAPADHNPPSGLDEHSTPQAQRAEPEPGLLSRNDPEPERSTSRAPAWLVIIIVLVVMGMVVLHLTGVVGSGTH